MPVEVVPYPTDAAGPATVLRLPAAVSPAHAIPRWSPDGELVIVARDGAMFVCPPDLRAVEPLAMLVDPVHEVAAAPAGPARVAAAGRRTAIVPLPHGRGRTPEPRLLDIGEDSSAVAWSPDGGTVAFGTRTGRVLIFEAATGAARGSLTAHERKIEDLCFSPDGLCLVTADQDCVRLSEVATLTTFDEIRPGWEVRAIAVTADGGRLAIAGRDAETTRDSRARLVVMEFDRP
jgi:WD40 repeat protein